MFDAICRELDSDFEEATVMYEDVDGDSIVFVYHPLDEDARVYIDEIEEGDYAGHSLSHAPEYSDDGYLAFRRSA